MSSLATQSLPGTTYDPFYPDSDGEPMGDTDFHTIALIALREGLEDFLANRPDAYVASNRVLYFQQGAPSGRRDPDVLVALGVDNHIRRSFRTWEEHAVPNVVFEISSANTSQIDLGEKRTIYESIGIPEYFLFDPEGAWLSPTLQGFRLVNGAYVELQPAPDGSLLSLQLGLRLIAESPRLRLIDAITGAAVLTPGERADQEKERADQEKLLAAQQKERADQAIKLAAQEKERADQAIKLAAQEKLLAAQFKAEVERLQALLAASQRPPD